MLSPKDVTDKEIEILERIRGRLERAELRHWHDVPRFVNETVLDMRYVDRTFGKRRHMCIGGMVGLELGYTGKDLAFYALSRERPLKWLYLPHDGNNLYQAYKWITPNDLLSAINNFLMRGDPLWPDMKPWFWERAYGFCEYQVLRLAA